MGVRPRNNDPVLQGLHEMQLLISGALQKTTTTPGGHRRQYELAINPKKFAVNPVSPGSNLGRGRPATSDSSSSSPVSTSRRKRRQSTSSECLLPTAYFR